MIDSHRSWIKEDSEDPQLKIALADFKSGWMGIAASDEEAFKVLQPIYATPLLDALLFLEGEQYHIDGALPSYHVHHKKWHPVYRKAMTERNYYDVFMFDLKGNMVYSVFKEKDFATNFGTKKNLDPKFAEWQDSGLGDAFRAALLEPQSVHLTPWQPYGPSAGALASFLATGVTRDDGSLIGVFSTQLPPEAMSIENVEPDCSLTNIADSFEGSINFVGLGQRLNMDDQVPCFKGRTARAYMELLDAYLASGYPEGDSASQVSDPYMDMRAHSSDGACVFAYTVRHLLSLGHSMQEIEGRSQEVYDEIIRYIKTDVDFQGVSGHVKFEGNDKQAYLAVQQVQAGLKVLVGTCSWNASLDLSVNGGPSNASWKPPHPDEIPYEEPFPYLVFQVLLPVLCICCPALAACIRNF
jgi:hypothetical protein